MNVYKELQLTISKSQGAALLRGTNIQRYNIMSIRSCQFGFSSLGSEIDSLFTEIEACATSLMNQSGASNLPAAVKNSGMSIFGNNFQVDLCENENEIIVTSDLPDLEKDNISVKLLDPDTLVIKAEQIGDAGTYHRRERRNGCMQRSIHLPSPVANRGAKASFKNGVMEIVLKKEIADEGVHIEIE